jgi:pimeloyl-ACP methyl ester carboxylesterase
MDKISIKNRNGQKVVILVEEAKNSKGLAFVMHGLGGFKEQVHVQEFAQAFVDNDYTTVRFDTTNTFGESDGNYENATTTNYYEDLEDVIAWAKSQLWYQQPFILAGHSLGGICTALFAEKYPEKVKALAPISTVVSGALSCQAAELVNKEKFDEWKKTGWRISVSDSKPGLVKRLKWSEMEDRLKYDLMPNVGKLTMPVLLIVGENDDSTIPPHQKILYDKLPGKKELHIIPGAPHTFRDSEHLRQIKDLFDHWIKSLPN